MKLCYLNYYKKKLLFEIYFILRLNTTNITKQNAFKCINETFILIFIIIVQCLDGKRSKEKTN